MTGPASMKAVQQTVFGGPEVLRVVDAPCPEPGGTEVLVRVRAAGVNPVDWKTRAGNGYLRSFPLTPGWDVSGIVERVGLGVTRFVPGDEVLGMPWFPRPADAYAEFVTAPSRQLCRKPGSMTHLEAAGLPMAGLTAWQSLVDTAGVVGGHRVLVNGAAGGVGHLAVQVAKARGAHVVATARRDNHDFVRGLGADEVLDHTEIDVAAVVDGLDVVFDPVGGPDAVRWLDRIVRGGVLVAFGAGDLSDAAARRGVRGTGLLVEPDGHALEQLCGLVTGGELTVVVGRTLPLTSAAEAHRLGEHGRVRGKIVLEVS